MRRVLVLLTAAIALSAASVGFAPAASATVPSSISAGHVLWAGSSLRSANGRYVLAMQTDGNLVVYSGSTAIWTTHTIGSGGHLAILSNGNIAVYLGSHAAWSANTTYSGGHNTLTMQDDGVLTLRSGNGVVWSSKLGNGCGSNTYSHRMYVSISQQRGRACTAHQQLLITPLTTGMSAYGYGTPTGTYTINNKVRDTTLFPLVGGAYSVKYWMPYDGNIFGFHDASWQTIPFGSPLYTTQGSHGCIHLPGQAMYWFFAWAPVGTVVTIS
jgi:lipoprotein-anchoring transpeptidase ErfK/SrfK